MRVITICCHGTGFDSHVGRNQGELVDWVSRHIEGGLEIRLNNGVATNQQHGTHIVLEGPGSMASDLSTPITPPNMINPKTGNVRDVKVMTTREQKLFVKPFKNLAGVIGGHGWDANVKLAMNLLEQVNARAPITRINMVGWSRGGVTCIKLANALFETTWSSGLPCNIFAIDPVAGTYKGSRAENRTLNANVKHYVSTLAMHEQRKWFRVQDASRIEVKSRQTTCVMLPMPGRHNTAPIGETDVAKVTGNLACAFLVKFGTSLDAIHSPTMSGAGAMVAAYARMIVGLEGYGAGATDFGQKVMGGGLEPRAFLQSLQQYQKSSYWMNEHHRKCFKKDFSAVYDFMFHQPQGQDMVEISTLDRNFASLLRSGQGAEIRATLMSNGLLGGRGANLYTFKGIGRNRAASVSSDVLYKWPDDRIPVRA